MTAQAKRKVRPHVNQNARTMDSRLKDLTRMNSIMFNRSKVNEYLQEFLDKVYKILYAKGVTSNEKVELDSCQLKDVAQTWYTQWIDL